MENSTKLNNQDSLRIEAKRIMEMLCIKIPNRNVGSKGNRDATQFFEKELSIKGWDTKTPSFDVIDWHSKGAKLSVSGSDFEVLASPYSLGGNFSGVLTSASSVAVLEKIDGHNKIILLHGPLAKETLMPKNFIFYNPEEHQRIIKLLEESGVTAIVCATGNPAHQEVESSTFPMFEDGDFNIPSVYMTTTEGKKLLKYVGQETSFISKSKRIPATAYNVIGRNIKGDGERIVLTAHIDSKLGTPGALDNASGITTLLLLADLLKDYKDKIIEIVAFNGEDYYSIPGQMNYMRSNQGNFERIRLNINIDGIGYKEGNTAFSFFGLPNEIGTAARQIVAQHPNIEEGIQWPQGDHSMFVQAGRPAIALTSKWFLDNLYTQNITHTPEDNLEIVDHKKIVETAQAINSLIRNLVNPQYSQNLY